MLVLLILACIFGVTGVFSFFDAEKRAAYDRVPVKHHFDDPEPPPRSRGFAIAIVIGIIIAVCYAAAYSVGA